MSAILDKLLKGQKVEWETIGDLGILNRGKRLVRSQLGETGTYPVYQNSLTPLGYFDDKNTLPNTTFIIAAGAAGEIGHSKSEFWAADDCYFFKVPREKLNDKFIYYFLLTQKSKIVSQVRKASVPRLGRNSVENIAIPIPPLDVQAEIVRILDAFTAVTAELTAELNMREKQYQYYRDKLLSFSDVSIETDSNRQQQTALCERLTNNVKQNHQIIWKSLGELGQLIRGNGLQKSDFTETGFPAIHYGQIYTFYGTSTTETKSFVSYELAKKLKKVNKGDVVITNTSENLEDVGKALLYLGNEQAVTGGHATIFKPSEEILGKYFAYYTQTRDFFDQKRKLAKGTKVIDVSATDMAKIIIPIIPVHEQKRIVEILDKFEALTHSITEGLPKEIALLQQQYEYYR